MAGNRKPAQGGMHRFSTTPEQERLIAEEAKRADKPAHAVFREIVEAGFEAVAAGSGEPICESPGDGRQARAAGLANLAESAIADYAVFYMLRRIMAALGQDPDDLSRHPLAIASCLGNTECGTLIEIWERAGAKLADGADAFGAIVEACAESGVPPSMLTGPASIVQAPRNEGENKQKEGGNAKRRRKQKRQEGD